MVVGSKIIQISQCVLFFFTLNFYWVIKNPYWISLPDWIGRLNGIFFIFAFILGIVNRAKLFNISRGPVVFCLALLFVPVSGNIAEYFLNAQVVGAESFINELNNDDTAHGFKPFLNLIIIFLFCSRAVALTVDPYNIRRIVLASVFLQSIWGVAQTVYFVNENLLAYLPVQPFEFCRDSDLECLHVTRAVGLTENPFYYSWFMLVSFASLSILGAGPIRYVALISNSFSLSRSFILGSFFLLFCDLRKNLKYVISIALVSLLLVFLFYDDISIVISARLNGDEGISSRQSTNLWVVEQLLSGNLLGVGWAVNYYTDSTYANLLLKSGIPGVVSYACAWFVFFRKIYKDSNFDRIALGLSAVFFTTSFLVSSVESLPGVYLLFVLFWILDSNKRGGVVVLERVKI